MPIAVATSPAHVDGASLSSTVTTAAFDVPDGALLVVCVSANASSAGTTAATVTSSNGLTFGQSVVADYPTVAANGFAAIFTAPCPAAATGITVTVTTTGSTATTRRPSVDVFVVTGAHLDNPVASSARTSSTLNAPSYAPNSTVANSLSVVAACEWNKRGTPAGSTGFNAARLFDQPASYAGAAPTTRARAMAANNTASTSHTITLPTGVVAGDRLVVEFTADLATTTTSTTSTGWTKLIEQAQGTTTNHVAAVYTKVATGSDALVITTSASVCSTHTSHAVQNAGTPQVQQNNGGSATSVSTPSITPTTGTANYLCILSVHTDSSSTIGQSLTVPSGFANLQSQNPTSVSSAASFSMERTYTGVATITPANATLSVAEQWIAFTIAIPPAPSTDGVSGFSGYTLWGPVGAQSYALDAAGTAAAAWNVARLELRPAPVGTGSLAATLDRAGTGRKVATGTGSVDLALGATGTGRRVAAGTGTAALALDRAGTGRKVASGTGSAASPLDRAGTGWKTASTTGTAALALDRAGTGRRTASTTGTAAVVVDRAATGRKTLSATSSAPLALAASGHGTQGAPVSGSGSTPLSLDRSGTGGKVATGTGSAALSLATGGTGRKTRTGAASVPMALTAAGTGRKTLSAAGAAPLAVGAPATGRKVLTRAATQALTLGAPGTGRIALTRTGAQALTLGTTGTGRKTLSRTGTAVLALAATGFKSTRSGTGTQALGLGTAGTGRGVRTGTGDKGLALGRTGTGRKARTGTGVVALALELLGAGTLQRRGAAAVALALGRAAVGRTDRAGAAALELELAPTGSGGRDVAGTAALELELDVLATGVPAPRPGTGTVALALAIRGGAERQLTGAGHAHLSLLARPRWVIGGRASTAERARGRSLATVTGAASTASATTATSEASG